MLNAKVKAFYYRTNHSRSFGENLARQFIDNSFYLLHDVSRHYSKN